MYTVQSRINVFFIPELTYCAVLYCTGTVLNISILLEEFCSHWALQPSPLLQSTVQHVRILFALGPATLSLAPVYSMNIVRTGPRNPLPSSSLQYVSV